jgi:transcriptional regulator with XRE-family HTH domain
MPFADRLAQLRKKRGLTQDSLAEHIGLTKTQIYRYERNNAQPTLDVIKRLAIALSVSTDELIFEENERQPDQDMTLLFEGVKHLSQDEKHVIRELIEGMIVKHQTKALVSNLSS